MGALVKIFIPYQLNIADVGKVDPFAPGKLCQDGVHIVIRIFGNRAGASVPLASESTAADPVQIVAV
jgi:hypothetical protein